MTRQEKIIALGLLAALLLGGIVRTLRHRTPGNDLTHPSLKTALKD